MGSESSHSIRTSSVAPRFTVSTPSASGTSSVLSGSICDTRHVRVALGFAGSGGAWGRKPSSRADQKASAPGFSGCRSTALASVDQDAHSA